MATISSPLGFILSSAPLSWKRDSSLDTANSTFATMRRNCANGTSMARSFPTSGRVGKSCAGRPWILKRDDPAVMVSAFSSSWSFTWSPTSARMISMNFLACTAIAPSRLASASTQLVSETSRSVAAIRRRSSWAVSSRCESTGMVVRRSTMPCIGISSPRNSLRLTRISIRILRWLGQYIGGARQRRVDGQLLRS